ncbi:hypothetical protein R83H12_02883 [Fibrobacteria bacterium R8-3-H12]
MMSIGFFAKSPFTSPKNLFPSPLHDVCPKNLFSTGGQAAHAVKTSEERRTGGHLKAVSYTHLDVYKRQQ